MLRLRPQKTKKGKRGEVGVLLYTSYSAELALCECILFSLAIFEDLRWIKQKTVLYYI